MSDDTCPTIHGHLRCMHARGHVGNCEVEDSWRCPINLGPYMDLSHTVAYVRGAIDFAYAGHLDTIGSYLKTKRRPDEEDCRYRARLLGALP